MDTGLGMGGNMPNELTFDEFRNLQGESLCAVMM